MAARAAAEVARDAMARIQAELGHRLPAARLDREVRERHLALVCGGGGGTGYVYLAACACSSRRAQPELIAGTSMGAILSLFRSRERASISCASSNPPRAHLAKDVPHPAAAQRYGVPGPLRLYLRTRSAGGSRTPTAGRAAVGSADSAHRHRERNPPRKAAPPARGLRRSAGAWSPIPGAGAARPAPQRAAADLRSPSSSGSRG